MGGLGYSNYSNFGDFMNDHDSTLSLEGDNKVILMQTANFLIKNSRKVLLKGKDPIFSCEYMKEYRDN
jgi:hypothetical protein